MERFFGYLNLHKFDRGPSLTAQSKANWFEDAHCFVAYSGDIRGYLSETQSYVSLNALDEIVDFFKTQGIDRLGSLNGDFVCVYFDKLKKYCYVGRSCTAYRQLYFKETNGEFYFSSECQSLLEQGEEVNVEAVHHFLDWQCVPAPLTFWRRISKLNPGEILEITSTGRKIRQVTPPVFPCFKGTYQAAVKEVRRLCHDIFTEFLDCSSGEIGVLMSSGIDSTAIASFLAKHAGSRAWRAWHLDVEHSQFSEKKETMKTAEILGCPLTVLSMSMQAASLESNGDPSADASALALNDLVDKIQHQSPCKILLLGDGADELFGGYYRTHLLPLWRIFEYVPFKWVRSVWGWCRYWPEIRNERTRWGKVLRLLRSLKRPSYYRMLFCRYPTEERREIYQTDFKKLITSEVIEKFTSDAWDFRNLLDYEHRFYLLNHLALKHNNVFSKITSPKTFCPFMDLRLMVFVKSLPVSYLKCRGRKGLLIDAFRNELPRHVIKNPKKGFAVPLSEILTGEKWRERCYAVVNDEALQPFFDGVSLERVVDAHFSGKCDYSVFLYALIVLSQQLHFADNSNLVLHNENMMLN